MENEDEKPRFVDSQSRSEIVKLDWPISYKGRIYQEITVSRMTAAQVVEFVERAGTDKNARFPMFGDVPAEVLDMLDVDDDEKLSEVVARFTPRQFRLAELPVETREEPSR